MKDKADFYAVYIKEAHPSDGWKSSGNERVGIRIKQADQFEERVRAAETCCGALDLQIPLIVDGIDNRVGEAYSGFPDRIYVIDRDGKVAFKSGRGPFGFIPAEMEQELTLMLMSNTEGQDESDRVADGGLKPPANASESEKGVEDEPDVDRESAEPETQDLELNASGGSQDPKGTEGEQSE